VNSGVFPVFILITPQLLIFMGKVITYWFNTGVYAVLSSSMMVTIRVISCAQKSKFFVVGPCSSLGTSCFLPC